MSNFNFDLQLFAEKLLEVPEEYKGVDPEVLEKFAPQINESIRASKGKESGTSPEPEQNQTPEEAVEPNQDIEGEQEGEPEYDDGEGTPPQENYKEENAPEEDEGRIDEDVEQSQDTHSHEPAEKPHKGNVGIALRKEREKNRSFKEENESLKQALAKLTEKVDSLAKPMAPATAPSSQGTLSILGGNQDQTVQGYPQGTIVPPSMQDRSPQQNSNYASPGQNGYPFPLVPSQRERMINSNPEVKKLQDVTTQAEKEFERLYGRKPRRDVIEHEAEVVRDMQTLSTLQAKIFNDVHTSEQRKLEEENSRKRNVQEAVGSYQQWEQQETQKPDSADIDKYAQGQISQLAPKERDTLVQALGRLKRPQVFGDPNYSDVVMVQNFWNLCRLGAEKDRMAQAPVKQPLVEQHEAEVEEDLPDEESPTVSQGEKIKEIPRTGMVRAAKARTAEWTLNKVKQYLKSGKYEEIPEKYRKSLLEGKWPPQRG